MADDKRTKEATPEPLAVEVPIRGPYADWRGPYEEMAEPDVEDVPAAFIHKAEKAEPKPEPKKLFSER